MSMINKKDPLVELVELENGLLWPYFNQEKAWSASSLTSILKEIEYLDKQIPTFVLQKAANNGKIFHQKVQEFIQGNVQALDYLDNLFSGDLIVSLAMQEKLKETINFIEQNRKTLAVHSFLGSERLHYTFYKGMLIATYTDLEFENCVVELKSNSNKMLESPLTLLSFQIQLLIQYLCIKKIKEKDIYLLWSTGGRVIFHKFKISPDLLEILDILIDVTKNKETYSFQEKRNIVEKILETYLPERI